MFSYQDSNIKVIIPSAIVLFLAFAGIGLFQVLHDNIQLGVVVIVIALSQLGFLLSLIYTFRVDFTGITKYGWLSRTKKFIPINKIDKVIYKKRTLGGFSRKAYLEVCTTRKKELFPLIKPKTEHYELLRLIHGCGIEIEIQILQGHYFRKATKEEIDNLFNFGG